MRNNKGKIVSKAIGSVIILSKSNLLYLIACCSVQFKESCGTNVLIYLFIRRKKLELSAVETKCDDKKRE